MNWLNLSPTKTRIIVGFKGYQFLSCYSEKEITFRFYIAPFKREVWYGIVSSWVIIYLAMEFSVQFGTKLGDRFPIWMTVLAGILDEWGQIPGKVEKRTFTRFLFGP